MSLRLVRLTGAAIEPHLDALADLRIRVFHDYPYLYEGSRDYERRYLRTYAEAEHSVVVGAFDGYRLVGAATALPLRHEPPGITEPFRAAGFAADRIFYFGESILLPEYRGQGTGVRFFAEREGHARAVGGHTHAAFAAVIRPGDHPRRPADYKALDDFWRHRGFAPAPGIVCRLSWRDRDETHDSPKPMAVWMKALT